MNTTPISLRRVGQVVILSVVLSLLGCHGFTLPRISFVNHRISRGLITKFDPRGSCSVESTTALPAAALTLTTDYSSLAQPVPYGPHLSIKGKILNGWGVLYALCVFSVAVLVLPFMFIAATIADLTGKLQISICPPYKSLTIADLTSRRSHSPNYQYPLLDVTLVRHFPCTFSHIDTRLSPVCSWQPPSPIRPVSSHSHFPSHSPPFPPPSPLSLP